MRLLLKTSLALLFLSLVGYLIWEGYGQSWAGFQGYYNSEGEYVRSKTFWDWMGLLVVPLSLALIAYLFSRQERKIDREIAAEQYQQRLLQDYLDRISKLLLEKELDESKSEGRITAVAQVLTLTVLRQSDALRRGEILRFLHEAKLIEREKRIVDLQGAELSGAAFPGLNLKKVDLSGAIMERCDLRKANLLEANLSGVTLNHSKLDHAILQNADLRDATLNHSKLDHAILEEAELSKATLNSTKLNHANLKSAILMEVTMNRCSLRRANLRGARFPEYADLSRCDFAGAFLQGADLYGAKTEHCSFKNAQYDHQTTWPPRSRFTVPTDAIDVNKMLNKWAAKLRMNCTIVKQLPNHCVPACLESVAKDSGISITQEDIVRQFPTVFPNGVLTDLNSSPNLEDVIRHFGLADQTHRTQFQSVEHLAELHRGNEVLLMWGNVAKHCVRVCSCDVSSQSVAVMDPEQDELQPYDPALLNSLAPSLAFFKRIHG
jgi:uncharacterized protein YjbI with pentapeptide repeats